MYYYVYKITNKINDKIYIGVHRTKDLSDGYMGSGSYLKRAQLKYGIENFEKEILFIYDNPEQMYEKEAEIVNAEFILNESNYNLTVGGVGDFSYINNNRDEDYYRIRSENGKKYNFITTNADTSKFFSKKGKDCNLFGVKTKTNFALDKDLQAKALAIATSQECIEKKKETFKNIKHQQGEINSQYGTIWITNDVDSIKIKNTDPIPEGWRRGRKMKSKN